MFQPELLPQIQTAGLIAPIRVMIPILRFHTELGIHPDPPFVDGCYKHNLRQLVLFPDLLKIKSQLQVLFFLLVQ